MERCPQVLEANLAPTVLFLKRMEIAGLGQCEFMDRPGLSVSGSGTSSLFPQTEAGWEGGRGYCLGEEVQMNFACVAVWLQSAMAERTGPGCYCLTEQAERGQLVKEPRGRFGSTEKKAFLLNILNIGHRMKETCACSSLQIPRLSCRPWRSWITSPL